MPVDTFELNKLRYKVLFSFYSKCQGLLTSIIWSQFVAQDLRINEENSIPFETAVRYLWNESLIERKALGEGYSLTYQGFDEIEGSIINPNISTPHFMPNIIKYVKVTDTIKNDIINSRKNRALFLAKAYEAANGDTRVIIDGYELAKSLNFDKSTFKQIYEYLEASGRIEHHYSGGGFSLTQLSLNEIEEPIQDNSYDSVWVNMYPILESAYDTIIDDLDQINTYCKARIGCKIFTANAKILKDLRNDMELLKADSRDRNAFVLIVACVASIIDQVEVDDMLKYIKKTSADKRSVNLTEQLFEANDIKYDNILFEKLRRIRSLRNKIQPIHPADHEALEIFQYLDIDPEDNDWGKAAEIYISGFIDCLDMIKRALKS